MQPALFSVPPSHLTSQLDAVIIVACYVRQWIEEQFKEALWPVSKGFDLIHDWGAKCIHIRYITAPVSELRYFEVISFVNYVQNSASRH